MRGALCTCCRQRRARLPCAQAMAQASFLLERVRRGPVVERGVLWCVFRIATQQKKVELACVKNQACDPKHLGDYACTRECACRVTTENEEKDAAKPAKMGVVTPAVSSVRPYA